MSQSPLEATLTGIGFFIGYQVGRLARLILGRR